MASTTQTQTTRGLKVACLHCGEAGGVVLFADAVERFLCVECNEEWTREEVEEHLASAARWQRLLTWIDAAPTE